MTAPDIVSGGGLSAPYTNISTDEAIHLAESTFGIRGSAKRFETEKDDTFRIDAVDGRRFVLKVSNPSEDLDEIDFQIKVMQYVAGRDPTVPIPRIVPSLGGASLSPIVDSAKQSRHVRLMTYLDGIPLDSTHSTVAEREKVGEVLARLRFATAGFTHPAEDRVLAWDVQHVLSLRDMLPAVDDREHRSMLERGLERMAEIDARVHRLRTQVLHNDFSRSNIVVDHASPEFVRGIIDFGDAVRTAIAIDVSTALLNQLPRDAATNPTDDLFAAAKDVLRGYLRIADLTDEELALIPHLTMARVIARALITHWRVRRFPENARYIMRNTEQGWAQLEWFLERPMASVSETLAPAAVAAK